MNGEIEQILNQEGISLYHPKSLLDIPSEVQKASIDLFRFLPQLSDPRWSIAKIWSENREAGVKKIHEEASQLAIYLSSLSSYRNGYSSYQSSENIRLICRAAVNLSSQQKIKNLFEYLITKPRICHFNLSLAVTNRISLGSGSDGVTGCPEALYQIQLRRNSKYVGRVGFNLHQFDSQDQVSITNLQGVPNASAIYEEMRQSEGCDPFVYLVNQVKNMFPDSSISGLKNPKVHPEFYNTVFKHSKVKRISFSRN